MKDVLKRNQNPSILNNFLDYLLVFKNFSIGTAEGYGIDLRCFFRFLKVYYNLTNEEEFDAIDVTDVDIFLLKRVQASDVEAFLFAMSYDKNLMVNTKNRKLNSINSFYEWLCSNTPVIKNIPTSNVNQIPNVRKLPKYLSLDKCKKIKNIFNSTNSKNYKRDNLIIEVFLATGIRVSELTNIKLGDINLTKKQLIIFGKGSKERLAYLNNSITTLLKQYINDIYGMNYNASIPLFMGNKKQKLSRRQVEYIVEKAYKLAGLGEYGYTVHTLRHTYATLMYMYGKIDILILKELLGHTSLKATEIYTHVYNESLKNAINNNPLSNYSKVA